MLSPVRPIRAMILAFCVFLHPAPSLAEEGMTPKLNPLIVYFLASSERDNAFIEAATVGAKRAERELGVKYSEHRIPRDRNMYDALKEQAEQGYSPIIAIGHQNVLPTQNLAEQFPKTRFIVIDGLVPPLYPNVQSITFRDHEGAFLVGYIAAVTSQSNHVGFVGGMNVPLIRNFAFGFEQGAKYANRNVRVDMDYIGTTPKSWSQPDRAFELAQKQMNSGADVVFAAAGGSSVGALKAAQVYNKFAIGVDTNQNGLYPGHVLTSLVKRVDIAVYNTLKSCKDNTWQPGISMLGVKEGALDYSVDENNKNLIGDKLVENVAGVKERIMNGIINVDSYTIR